MAGALIVTAEIAQRDFSWIESLRRAHYPPQRNRVPAHLTMFQALPPSAEPELRRRLGRIVGCPPPVVRIAGLIDLGGGVALRIESQELDDIRDELADGLHGLLSGQDSDGWKPHITIQNKVAPKVARVLKASLERSFEQRPLAISGIGAHRYLDGPWEKVAVYPFRT
jgi:hypothetical protein